MKNKFLWIHALFTFSLGIYLPLVDIKTIFLTPFFLYAGFKIMQILRE